MSYDNTGYRVYRFVKARCVAVFNEINGKNLYEVSFAQYPYPSILRKHYTAKDELDAFVQFDKEHTTLPPHVPFPGIDS